MERLEQGRRDAADLAEPRRVEAGAVPEHAPHLLVLPRRHLLEVLEEPLDVRDRETRPPQQPVRRREVARANEPRRLLDLVPRVLQPELGRLVDHLEEQLVTVHPFVRLLLEREQLVGAEVALVVARALARQDRLELVGVRRAHQIRISNPASGTPPSSVTSQVSCI